MELKKKDYDEIDNFCKSSNIEWFASAWDINSLKFLDNYNLNYHKIASAMIVDEEFVEEVAKRGKYTFISTGMSTMENIKKAVEIFRNHKTPFELMHCCSAYPMKTHDANLLSIGQIKKLFNCKVGYSGHEAGLAVSYAAAMQGISSLERHITLDRTMYGSDQAASLELSGMKNLTESLKKFFIAFGEPKLGFITEEEKLIAKKLRSHLKV